MWHQNSPFSTHYPRLYAITTKQKNLIKDMWNPDSLDWDLFPRRQLRSWESSHWNELKTFISSPISASAVTLQDGSSTQMVAFQLLRLKKLSTIVILAVEISLSKVYTQTCGNPTFQKSVNSLCGLFFMNVLTQHNSLSSVSQTFVRSIIGVLCVRVKKKTKTTFLLPALLQSPFGRR